LGQVSLCVTNDIAKASTDINSSSFDPDSPFLETAERYSQRLENSEQSLDYACARQGQRTNVDRTGASSLDAYSMQQIVKNRRTVEPQYGQITQSKDTMSGFPLPKKAIAEPTEVPDAKGFRMNNLEQFHNAMSQRYTKTKRIRGEKKGNDSADSNGGEDKVDDQKEKYRGKSKLAAAKCRARKKESTEDIIAKHRKLSFMNSSTKEQVQHLRDELTALRTHALSHQDCDCPIVRYNINQANIFAQTDSGAVH
jgi:hypothetical protein